jgi:hypothetical protein
LMVKPAWPMRWCHCWVVRSLPSNIVCSSSNRKTDWVRFQPISWLECETAWMAHTGHNKQYYRMGTPSSLWQAHCLR